MAFQAVSYTHLDVYKIQDQKPKNAMCSPRLTVQDSVQLKLHGLPVAVLVPRHSASSASGGNDNFALDLELNLEQKKNIRVAESRANCAFECELWSARSQSTALTGFAMTFIDMLAS